MCHVSYPVSLMCSVPWESWSLGTASNPRHPSSFQLSLAMTTDSRWREQTIYSPGSFPPREPRLAMFLCQRNSNRTWLLSTTQLRRQFPVAPTGLGVAVQFSHSMCPDPCDHMDITTPGFPVHHQLPEPTQTHVHWVTDAIQTSHPLSAPSPPAFNLSQHQGLLKWVSSLHQVLQHQSYQWIFRTDFL